ncbi:SIS domain-containing protein [Schwartzia succinivorans]|jgi:D-sedoheptulose 7-phosphate isomerase|uniref:D-sedoheptulose 7-phosphate isomerase n=1 Tax=Schwartzia succinivorans DSM 10502 TaxID=1123243 RepID=A0A1M4XPI0_9FIRM|nr:SIS domain-containing protein [Schwartzia succinivorans]SHE95276.1 D-sedoheptulose 7-phosphate isomerase [Schwartzia succinivorans DSM 10502]
MKYIDDIIDLLQHIEISADRQFGTYDEGIFEILLFLRECKKNRKALFICGNGGSAGIAQHMTGDFLKNGGFRTFSMYGQPTITCISNDLSYEYVFCKQLELLANKDDLLIAISSSGNSENIIKAVKTIKKIGGKVITFSGFKSDNKLKTLGDINVYVPAEHYGMVESIHNLILQQLVDIIVDEDGVAMRLNTDD